MTEHDINKRVYGAVHVGEEAPHKAKSWSSEARQTVERRNQHDQSGRKPQQCETENYYDEHLKHVLLCFHFELLISCRRLPRDFSHPYLVGYSAVQDDYLQQRKGIKENDISSGVYGIVDWWNIWLPEFKTVPTAAELIDSIHIE